MDESFSVNDDTIRSAIRRALQDIKDGNALEEADLDRIMKQEAEVLEKFLAHVAKSLAQERDEAQTQLKAVLESKRELCLEVIRTFDTQSKESSVNGEETAPQKEQTTEEVKPDDGEKDLEDTDEEGPVEQAEGEKPEKNKPLEGEGEDKSEKPLENDEKELEDTDEEDPVEQAEGEKPEKNKPLKGEGCKSEKPPENEEKEAEAMDVDEDAKEKQQKSKKRKKSDHVEDDEAKKTPAKKKAKGAKTPARRGSSTKKAPRRNSATKKKREATPSAKVVEASRTAAKQEFESEKARILDEIPEEYKDRWGQIGFTKWGKEWLACLIVSPYDVGPMSAGRAQWMQMFENTKGRRHAMTLLIYWYGSEDLSSAYSFIQSKAFKSYEEGVKKNLDKLPPRIQKKLDAGKPLTKKERERLASIEEMREDLEKSPEDRRIREPFQELYEMDRYVEVLATGEGVGSSDVGDESSDDKELKSDSDQEVEDEDESDSDSFQEVVKRPKAKKPTKRKPPAKKKKKEETESEPKKPAKAPPAEDFVDDMKFVEADLSSDEEKDEDVEPPSEEDEDDEDFEYEKETKPKRPKKTPSSQGKKEKKAKHTIERKRQKKKEPKEVSIDTKKKRERKIFQENEELFLPMLAKWKAAIESEDTVEIGRVLREILDNVDSMGAPFMEEYKISPMMKDTKAVLKKKNADTSRHKTLRLKLLELHTAKKPLVPEGFKPRKRKDRMPDESRQEPSQPEKEDSQQSERTSMEVDFQDSQQESVSGSQLTVASLTSPLKRDQSQDSTISVTSPQPETKSSSQGSKAAARKFEKKAFSLNKLFKAKPDSGARVKSSDSDRAGKATVQKAASLPSWIVKEPGELGPLPSEKVDRSLALDFFEGAASRFPADKVNRDAIARALEAAVYQWCQEQYKKEDAYWGRVHMIVASICGKRKPGSVVNAIMAGEYASAKDVVFENDDVLHRSFEGS